MSIGPAYAPDRPSRPRPRRWQISSPTPRPSPMCGSPRPHRHPAPPLDGASRLIFLKHSPKRGSMPSPFPQSRRRSGTRGRRRRRLQWQAAQGHLARRRAAHRHLPLVVNYEEGSELAVGDGDGLTERGLSESAVRAVGPNGKARFWRWRRCTNTARAVRLSGGSWIFSMSSRSRARFYVLRPSRLERNAKAGRARIRGRGHDVVVARLSLGGRDAALPRAGSASTSASPSPPITETTGRAGPSGWYCRYGAEASTRARLVVEEGGLSLRFPTPTNDDLPYWDDGRRQEAPGDPLFAGEQRFRGSPRAIFGAARVLRGAPALTTFDRPLQGGRDPSQDDVDRPAYACCRPSGPVPRPSTSSSSTPSRFPMFWFARRIEIAKTLAKSHHA